VPGRKSPVLKNSGGGEHGGGGGYRLKEVLVKVRRGKGKWLRCRSVKGKVRRGRKSRGVDLVLIAKGDKFPLARRQSSAKVKEKEYGGGQKEVWMKQGLSLPSAGSGKWYPERGGGKKAKKKCAVFVRSRLKVYTDGRKEIDRGKTRGSCFLLGRVQESTI